MISFKRLSGRRGEEGGEDPLDISPPNKPARDVWNVVVESMIVGEEPVFALCFQRRGTSVYYLHRHYRNRMEADRESNRLTHDLTLEQADFELKYALDIWG